MTHAKRRSTAKKLVASSALVGSALALTFGGAFASFTDTVSAGPQTINSGVISLATGPTNDSALGATAIVPGDTVSREIDLNSTAATANAGSISLGFTASTSSLLDTDAVNGLQLSIKACAAAPVRTAGPPPTYVCAPGWTPVTVGGLAATSVSALEKTAALLAPLNSLTAKKQDYLVFTLTFPATAPGDLSKYNTACSGTPNGNVTTENLEGCTSVLSYTFVATQRASGTE
jgi:spore coat-associated protein N